jgi:metal-sulfur cluster biosynthetic enzyme
MGLGNMLGKLFKKESGTAQKSGEALSPANALTDTAEQENIYETASLDEAGSKSAGSSDGHDSASVDTSDQTPESADSLSTAADTELTQESVLKVLSEVYDPEIPIDIVNLGLIYGVDIEGSNVNIRMTMTAPGCPASAQIAGESKILVEEMPGVESVEIELVWDPPWDPSKMSEEAQQSMGM